MSRGYKHTGSRDVRLGHNDVEDMGRSRRRASSCDFGRNSCYCCSVCLVDGGVTNRGSLMARTGQENDNVSSPPACGVREALVDSDVVVFMTEVGDGAAATAAPP